MLTSSLRASSALRTEIWATGDRSDNPSCRKLACRSLIRGCVASFPRRDVQLWRPSVRSEMFKEEPGMYSGTTTYFISAVKTKECH